MNERESLCDARTTQTVCSYCGFLNWTIKRYGRVTHKHACPNRTDAKCQSHPEGCPNA